MPRCTPDDKLDWVQILGKAILLKANVQTLDDQDDALMVSTGLIRNFRGPFFGTHGSMRADADGAIA